MRRDLVDTLARNAQRFYSGRIHRRRPPTPELTLFFAPVRRKRKAIVVSAALASPALRAASVVNMVHVLPFSGPLYDYDIAGISSTGRVSYRLSQ